MRRPVFPIGSFFDASRKLVWPSDAPVDGDLTRSEIPRIRLAWSSRTWSRNTVSPDHHRDRCSGETARLRSTRLQSFELRRRGSRRTSTSSCFRSTTHLRPRPILPRSWRQRISRLDLAIPRLAYRASSRETTGSRFLRDRSIWTTVPSRPISTLAGISEIP